MKTSSIAIIVFLVQMVGLSTAIADDSLRLPGVTAPTWSKPTPIAVGEFASHATARIVPGKKSEGWRFIESLPEQERKKLLQDGVYLVQEEDEDSPSKGGGNSVAVRAYIRAYAMFKQSKERTLELMFEPEKLVLFLEELDAASTVRRDADLGELTKFTVEFLWIDIDFWIQHWFYPEYSRYDWFLDTEHYDNDIDGNMGFWQMYALSDTESVGEYGVQVDTGIPLPRKWIERIQRRKIPDSMRQFQRYINSNGSYRKD